MIPQIDMRIHRSLGALVLAPLLAGGVFNYWYWVGFGARFLGTDWPRFLFQRQR